MVEHDGEGYLEPIADEDLFNTIAHMFMERLEEEFDFVEDKACAIPAVFAYKLFYLIQHV